tara:strand:+ start:824 stop:1222 length:399 start_codon:yes stop_codon:yes gene_type:complete
MGSSYSFMSSDDIQRFINDGRFIIINTMTDHNQSCLIKGTIHSKDESNIINNIISNKIKKKIIVYGMNWYDQTVYTKFKQLKKYGFDVYIYSGGIFEWLSLQDIYGSDEFPTDGKEYDIFKYRPKTNNQFLV